MAVSAACMQCLTIACMPYGSIRSAIDEDTPSPCSSLLLLLARCGAHQSLHALVDRIRPSIAHWRIESSRAVAGRAAGRATKFDRVGGGGIACIVVPLASARAMKAGGTLKSRRGSVGDEELEAGGVGSFPLTPRKECWWSSGLVKAVTVLLILMTGVLIGLAASANVSRYYYYMPPVLPLASDAKAATTTTGGSQQQQVLEVTGSTGSSSSSHHPMSFKLFVHPGSPWGHSMSDEELFWRASMVPRVEEYPYQRVPKVAFLFLTRGPLPFAGLWERFFRGHQGLYSVYVHALPDYRLNVSASSPFYGRQIPSQEVSWGSITLVDAEKRLLANALLDYSNERFVLVSESCIPVFNFPTVYEYLINSAQSYVESYNIDVPQCAGRYNPRMAPDVMEEQWRKGSEWFELSRELAVDIVADRRYYAIFRKHCTPSCYPDEHYIPTYLHLLHGPRNGNRTITWVDWSRGGPHPARYGKASVTREFVQAIRNNGTRCLYNGKPTTVCYLFARKFAPSALATLLNLTTTLLDF